MIRSFGDLRTEAVFSGRQPKGLPTEIFRVARRKLAMINAATSLDDLKVPPGNRLHPLLNDRSGQYAIWVNSQYRVCFYWRDGGAEDVEITDYH